MRKLVLVASTVVLLALVGGPTSAAGNDQPRHCYWTLDQVAYIPLTASHASCGSASRVARTWDHRVRKRKCSIRSCSSLGYKCVGENRKVRKHTIKYNIVCRRGLKRISWIGITPKNPSA